jgi:hypothetical protein
MNQNSSYRKKCNYCPQDIVMSQRLGKWYPSDLDGGIHRCSTNGEGNGKKQANILTQKEGIQLKDLLSATLIIQQLDERLKRVERIVVDPRK